MSLTHTHPHQPHFSLKRMFTKKSSTAIPSIPCFAIDNDTEVV